jgi:hypothetical protein
MNARGLRRDGAPRSFKYQGDFHAYFFASHPDRGLRRHCRRTGGLHHQPDVGGRYSSVDSGNRTRGRHYTRTHCHNARTWDRDTWNGDRQVTVRAGAGQFNVVHVVGALRAEPPRIGTFLQPDEQLPTVMCGHCLPLAPGGA